MNKQTMGVAIATLILASSCGSSKDMLQTSALEGEWNIMTVNGKKAEAEKTPYIGMDLQKNRLYGCAGCNRIMGSLQVDSLQAGHLSFGQIGSTRMLCADMNTERAVLEALNQVSRYKGTEEELTLTDKKGHSLLTLNKRPASTLASLSGSWNIAHVHGHPIDSIEKTDKIPFLEFNTDKKTVHGNTGCNIVNGGFSQKEGLSASLEFGQLISTMMAGPGMTLERQVLDAMNNVKSFVVKDNQTVSLLDENGEEVLTLKKP